MAIRGMHRHQWSSSPEGYLKGVEVRYAYSISRNLINAVCMVSAAHSVQRITDYLSPWLCYQGRCAMEEVGSQPFLLIYLD